MYDVAIWCQLIHRLIIAKDLSERNQLGCGCLVWNYVNLGYTESELSPEQNLKLNILANGMVIDPTAEVAWKEEFEGPLSLNEYASTNGICVKVEDGADGVYINAPYSQEFTKLAEARLRFEGQFLIDRVGVEFETTVIPVPAYHAKTYVDKGVEYPYTNLGVTHKRFVIR